MYVCDSSAPGTFVFVRPDGRRIQLLPPPKHSPRYAGKVDPSWKPRGERDVHVAPERVARVFDRRCSLHEWGIDSAGSSRMWERSQEQLLDPKRHFLPSFERQRLAILRRRSQYLPRDRVELVATGYCLRELGWVERRDVLAQLALWKPPGQTRLRVRVTADMFNAEDDDFEGFQPLSRTSSTATMLNTPRNFLSRLTSVVSSQFVSSSPFAVESPDEGSDVVDFNAITASSRVQEWLNAPPVAFGLSRSPFISTSTRTASSRANTDGGIAKLPTSGGSSADTANSITPQPPVNQSERRKASLRPIKRSDIVVFPLSPFDAPAAKIKSKRRGRRGRSKGTKLRWTWQGKPRSMWEQHLVVLPKKGHVGPIAKSCMSKHCTAHQYKLGSLKWDLAHATMVKWPFGLGPHHLNLPQHSQDKRSPFYHRSNMVRHKYELIVGDRVVTPHDPRAQWSHDLSIRGPSPRPSFDLSHSPPPLLTSPAVTATEQLRQMLLAARQDDSASDDDDSSMVSEYLRGNDELQVASSQNQSRQSSGSPPQSPKRCREEDGPPASPKRARPSPPSSPKRHAAENPVSTRAPSLAHPQTRADDLFSPPYTPPRTVRTRAKRTLSRP